MKQTLLEFTSPGWKQTVEGWKSAGLITITASPYYKRDGSKTGRKRGVAYKQIRAYALKHRTFSLDAIIEALKVERITLRSRLKNLARAGELSQEKRDGRNFFSVTPKTKTP